MHASDPNSLCIYFDESGYTGYNLLDRDQPIFAIASSSIDDAIAAEILQTAFPRYRGREFKFSNIWTRRNRRGLEVFSREIASYANQIYCFCIDKRFAVFTKMVDFLIEPVITSAGYDFYSDGFCWRYANYCYFGLVHFAPSELLYYLLKYYQEFSTAPSEDALNLLQYRLRMMANSVETEAKGILEQFSLGSQLFLKFNQLETFRSTNNLQTTTMIAIMAHWRQLSDQDFEVFHDTSSTFFRDRSIWNSITGIDVPAQEIPMGDGSVTPWPLRVISTTSMDSAASPAIQLCDVISGLCVKFFNNSLIDEDQQFINRVTAGGFGQITSNRLIPSGEFPITIPPQRLHGPDVVDRLTKIIFRQF